MTDTSTPSIDFDDPHQLISVGDMLRVLETDRDLARAMAEHHRLIRDPMNDGPIDMITLARDICWKLHQGEQEQMRRLYGEAAAEKKLQEDTIKNLDRRNPPKPISFAERLHFLNLTKATAPPIDELDAHLAQAAESGNFHGR